MQHKIKYTERYPDNLDLIFNSKQEYWKFFTKRMEEVGNKLDWFNPKSQYKFNNWIKSRVVLNKDGTPSKEHTAGALYTPESRARQKKKWQEYLDNKKKQKELALKQKVKLDEEAMEKAIKVLLENKVDLTRIEVKLRK